MEEGVGEDVGVGLRLLVGVGEVISGLSNPPPTPVWAALSLTEGRVRNRRPNAITAGIESAKSHHAGLP